jgi:hypothetical protein
VTDAELVALLLTEARAWREFDHLAWIRAKRELQAAVEERLDAEPELRAAVLGRLEADAADAERGGAE